MSDLNEQYKKFLTSELAPPLHLNTKIFHAVRKELNHARLWLWYRVFNLHLLTAGITLIFCPQFGIGPLGGLSGLFGFFMDFGPVVCAICCGAFYMGTTGLTLGFALNRSELRALALHRIRYLSLLSAASMMLLMLAQTFMNGSWPLFDWEFTIFWFLGAILCSVTGFNAAMQLRSRLWHIVTI